MKVLIILAAAAVFTEIFFTIVTMICPAKPKITIQLSNSKIKLFAKRCRFLPCTLRLKIKLENVYSGEKITLDTGRCFPRNGKVLYQGALSGVRCGVLKATVESAKISLGSVFFMRKVKLDAEGMTLKMPSICSVSGGFFASTGEESPTKRALSGLADGAREYRSGDRLADIHMKLSAKSGKYMTRERFGGGEVVMKMQPSTDPETAEINAQLAYSLACNILQSGGGCRILHDGRLTFINSYFDLERGFLEIFTKAGEAYPSSGADIVIAEGEVLGC